MKIEFEVDGRKVCFRRNWFTGNAVLVADGKHTTLQHAANLGTHFSFGLMRSWETTIADHRVVIEKHRPQWFAGFRPQRFRVLVDGAQVVETAGY